MNTGVNQLILLKRLADKVGDQRFNEFRSKYFSIPLPAVYLQRVYNYNYQHLFEKSYIPWLIHECKAELRKPAILRKHARQIKKMQKQMLREMELIKKSKDPLKRKRDFVHKFIDEVRKVKQDLLDRGWSNKHANDQVKLYFGLREVHKWIKQTDKSIDNKLSEIFQVIESIPELQEERRNPNHDCVDCGCPLHRKRERDLESALKTEWVLEKRLHEPGTNKWPDEEKFKKWKRAALRSGGYK